MNSDFNCLAVLPIRGSVFEHSLKRQKKIQKLSIRKKNDLQSAFYSLWDEYVFHEKESFDLMRFFAREIHL
ncbi:hypothetical protein AAJCM20276_35120 [Acetobacter aceti]|uniref:Uncharacterized protein n=1 Tax=Acetobacter aceti TaxID=435 RepID=A0A6S6PM09_ACEAC|nr:hypothetical protein AAJCM20276_35120 [Acetobacter aceti]